MSDALPIVERVAAILQELHDRLAMREVGESDELAALASTVHELDRYIDGEDLPSVLQGLDAVAGGLEPEIVTDSDVDETEDAEPF